uniref:Uncharacterized protein n=1 Tax=Ascaris lumbricoides TaxID=6252 RepID=A0A0M3IHV6_ASCLU
MFSRCFRKIWKEKALTVKITAAIFNKNSSFLVSERFLICF